MTLRDTVLAALTEDLGQSCDQLGADLGLETRQVSNSLHLLKLDGLAKYTPEGWVRVTQGATSAPAGVALREAMPIAPQPEQENPMPRPKKNAEPPRTKRKYTRRMPVASVPVAESTARELQFALTEAREIAIAANGVVVRMTGPEAMRLADFIAAVKPVLGAA